jgi:hypothetical protein
MRGGTGTVSTVHCVAGWLPGAGGLAAYSGGGWPRCGGAGGVAGWRRDVWQGRCRCCVRACRVRGGRGRREERVVLRGGARARGQLGAGRAIDRGDGDAEKREATRGEKLRATRGGPERRWRARARAVCEAVGCVRIVGLCVSCAQAQVRYTTPRESSRNLSVVASASPHTAHTAHSL